MLVFGVAALQNDVWDYGSHEVNQTYLSVGEFEDTRERVLTDLAQRFAELVVSYSVLQCKMRSRPDPVFQTLNMNIGAAAFAEAGRHQWVVL